MWLIFRIILCLTIFKHRYPSIIMKRYIELAITKYVRQYPGTGAKEVMIHLQSLGYTNEEAGQLDLDRLLELRQSSVN